MHHHYHHHHFGGYPDTCGISLLTEPREKGGKQKSGTPVERNCSLSFYKSKPNSTASLQGLNCSAGGGGHLDARSEMTKLDAQSFAEGSELLPKLP